MCLSLPKFVHPTPMHSPSLPGKKKFARAATGQVLSAAGWSYLPACDGRSWIQRKKQAEQCQQWCFFCVSLLSPETNSEFAAERRTNLKRKIKVRGFLWSPSTIMKNHWVTFRKTDMWSFSMFLVFFLGGGNLRPGRLKVKDIQPLGRGRVKPPIIGCQLPAARWWEPKFIACRDREAGDELWNRWEMASKMSVTLPETKVAH